MGKHHINNGDIIYTIPLSDAQATGGAIIAVGFFLFLLGFVFFDWLNIEVDMNAYAMVFFPAYLAFLILRKHLHRKFD